MKSIKELIEFIASLDGVGNKDTVKNKVISKFKLIRDRSVFYCDEFAIRFSYTSNNSFSNTVLSLSTLQKYDSIPFLVCLVTPRKNKVFLANTTFLSKISHSSQEFSVNNIKGSFNGSDIIKIFEGIENKGENIEELFAFHREFDFSENLSRLVEATNGIIASGSKFNINENARKQILDSVDRAIKFNQTDNFHKLQEDLTERMNKYANEIMIASHIENINIRGRLIEYLITEEDDDELKRKLIREIHEEYSKLPKFKTDNLLGDYKRIFNTTITETDIKTKIIILNSNPKAYNIDKFLEFLSFGNTIFLFFFIGIDSTTIVNSQLISVFQKDLLKGTRCIKHWAGRNSRGVTQFMGQVIDKLLKTPNNDIDRKVARDYLVDLIEL